MGDLLIVRVNATTFEEKGLKKRYPLLTKLAWPPSDSFIPAHQQYGVAELITTLDEAMQYADWNLSTKKLLADSIEKVVRLLKEFQGHILSWEPKEANTLSFTIEEALDEMEKLLDKEGLLSFKQNNNNN